MAGGTQLCTWPGNISVVGVSQYNCSDTAQHAVRGDLMKAWVQTHFGYMQDTEI